LVYQPIQEKILIDEDEWEELQLIVSRLPKRKKRLMGLALKEGEIANAPGIKISSVEGTMTKILYIFAFLFLTSGITLSYGYKPLTKGQQKEEVITTLDPKSITEKDRAHSKLFPRFKTGKKLSSQAFLEQESNSKQLSNEIVVKRYPPIIDIDLERRCPNYPTPGLVGLAYASDIIVMGTIKDKNTSQFTEGEEFLFSEYSVIIENVIKDNQSVPVEPNSAITVIRPGGRIRLGEKIITAVVPSFPPFIEGDRYILFLKFHPDTNSYQAFGNGSFPIIEGEIRTLYDPKTGPKQQAFIDEIRGAMKTELCQNVILN